jgi:hypothetical protein
MFAQCISALLFGLSPHFSHCSGFPYVAVKYLCIAEYEAFSFTLFLRGFCLFFLRHSSEQVFLFMLLYVTTSVPHSKHLLIIVPLTFQHSFEQYFCTLPTNSPKGLNSLLQTKQVLCVGRLDLPFLLVSGLCPCNRSIYLV